MFITADGPYMNSIVMQLAFAFLFISCTNSWADTYSVGVVPQFERRQIEQIWQPILNEVSRKSGVHLELNASTRIPEFEKEFESGKFHFAYMNPYHAIVANRKHGYQPILRDIGKRLFGVILVHKNSPFTDVKQLDGRKVAMPAPNALGAALLPRVEFVKIFKIAPQISYVRSHDSVYLNVALGVSDAGGGVMATLNRQPEKIRNQLRILHRTGNVPKHPLVVRPDVPANVVSRVQAAFLELGKTAKGQALLAKVPIKKIGKTRLEDYQVLIDMGLDAFYVRNN